MTHKPPKKFDTALFATMVEPLTVRVERRNGGASMPIELPPEEDQPSGYYSKDRIRGLEGWLVTDWTGGGVYAFDLSDSSDPPKRMEWLSVYPVQTYPMKTPPSVAQLMGNIAPPPPPPPPAPAPTPAPSYPTTQVSSMTSSQWPQFAPVGSVPAAPAPAPAPAPQVMYPSGPPQPGYYQGGYQQGTMMPTRSERGGSGYDSERERFERFEREKRELEAARVAAEQRALAAERSAYDASMQAERARVDAAHKADMERVRAENARAIEELRASITPRTDPATDQRFAKLEDLVGRLVDRVTAPAPAPVQVGPSPEIVALNQRLEQQARDAAAREDRLEREGKEREARLEAQLKEQRDREARAEERRDQERREDQLRQQMQQQADTLQAALRAQADATAQQIAQLAQMIKDKENTNRTDPMLDLLRDQQRQYQDNLRAIRDAAKDAADQVRAMMMSPEQVMAMIGKSNAGIDDVRRTMTGAMTDLFGMTRQAIEQISSMQPQGESPTTRILGDAVSGLTDVAKRYMTAKAQTGIAEQETQQQYIQAQVALQQSPPPIAQQPINVNPNLAQAAQHQAMQPAQPPQAPAAPQQAPAQPAPMPTPSAPLQGAAPAPALAPTPADGAVPIPTTVPIPEAPPAIVTIEAQGNVTSPKRGDLQWFGEALPQVLQLRQYVGIYLQAIQQDPVPLDPKTQRPVGLDPIDTAGAIMQAVAQIKMLGARISAFEDLLEQKRYADFMDALLPAPVPQAYRDDAMNLLIFALKGGDLSTVARPTMDGEGGEDGDDDDDDEDDDDGEHAGNGATAPVTGALPGPVLVRQ